MQAPRLALLTNTGSLDFPIRKFLIDRVDSLSIFLSLHVVKYKRCILFIGGGRESEIEVTQRFIDITRHACHNDIIYGTAIYSTGSSRH